MMPMNVALIDSDQFSATVVLGKTMTEHFIRIFLLQHHSVQVAVSSNPTSKTSYSNKICISRFNLMKKVWNLILKALGANFSGEDFVLYFLFYIYVRPKCTSKDSIKIYFGDME